MLYEYCIKICYLVIFEINGFNRDVMYKLSMITYIESLYKCNHII